MMCRITQFRANTEVNLQKIGINDG
jgi:hypothetical protein